MTAQSELSHDELNQVNAFAGERPKSHEGLLHKMWFSNALARYDLYVAKDIQKAQELTEKNITEASELFLQSFSEEDREKKSIIFILALNVVRLSFYRNDIPLCKLQIHELKSFVFHKTKIKKNIFSEDLTSLLNLHGPGLLSGMTEEDYDYYRLKLSIMESKLLSTLLESFELHVQDNSAKVAFIDYDKNQSYSWKDIESLADGISELIPAESKYALICSQQNILYVASILASWKTKTIPIMVHENYTTYELEQIKVNFQNQKVIVLMDEKHGVKVVERYKAIFGTIVNLSERVCADKKQDPTPSQKDDLALGLLTSGSSGPPKLCLFTHSNLLSAARIEAANEPVYQKGAVVNLRPHYTSAGLNSLWPSLLLATTNICSEKMRKTPIARFLNELIEKLMPSLLILSPTYIISLFQNADVELHSKYQLLLYFGGSSLPWNLITKLMNHNFLPSMRYGMTEVAHIISKKSFTLDQVRYEKADVGIPFKNVRLKIADGFVEISSPGMISRIVDQGIDSRISDNYRSLDKAELSPAGAIILEGRDNRTININGFRFNSQQVEEVLIESSFILDCRVLGILNENDEQKLNAFILVKNDELKTDMIEKNLRALASEKLSQFKQPSLYTFLHEWPMSVNGKIDFNKLKN